MINPGLQQSKTICWITRTITFNNNEAVKNTDDNILKIKLKYI